jgi:hypothetical protein
MGEFTKTIESMPIFETGSAVKTSSQTISTVSPSWRDVSSLTITFSLTRDSMMLFMLNISGYHADTDGIMYARIILDSLYQIGPKTNLRRGAAASIIGSASIVYAYKVPAGSHTVKVQANVSKTTGSIASTTNNAILSYLVLSL